MSRSNQIPSPPKKKHSGNAGRHGREWHLCSDLDGVVGVEAEQEQPYQGIVQPIETGRRANCNRICAREIGLPAGVGIPRHLSVSIPKPPPTDIATMSAANIWDSD